MLVLSRRVDQSVRIGEAIRITIVAIDGGAIRLGIEAPASARILREELYLSIAAANQAAIGESAVPMDRFPHATPPKVITP